MSASIKLQSVCVDFPIFTLNARSFKNHLLRITPGGVLRANQNRISVRALNNINLEINHGDRLGLIGPNGAGKSTLLRVLAKIYEPTAGHLEIIGKVSPLLDVMLGIDGESTGYENILIRGLLLGLTRKEIEEKKTEIAEFTGLGDYLQVPIRTYSQGMQMRLAFATATSIKPEILLLEEAINVGDAAFIQKTEDRLNSLIQNSRIVVIATHDNAVIRKICNKAVVLQKGEISYIGNVEDALAFYDEARKKIDMS